MSKPEPKTLSQIHQLFSPPRIFKHHRTQILDQHIQLMIFRGTIITLSLLLSCIFHRIVKYPIAHHHALAISLHVRHAINMKPALFSNLLAAFAWSNAVLAGSTHKQTGPFFLRASPSGDRTVDGQYLTPLVVDSEIVGLHFRLSKPCKEESAFFFDYTVTDGLASQSGLLRQWPALPDAIYARRFWQTMAFEQVPSYTLAVPRFIVSFVHTSLSHLSHRDVFSYSPPPFLVSRQSTNKPVL